jgi:hypothetical protein
MAGNRIKAERIAGYAAHIGVSARTLANMPDDRWPAFCVRANAAYADAETVGMAVDLLQAVMDAAVLVHEEPAGDLGESHLTG